ncbi:hypothetical protein C095_08295 [Fusobacterium necrophorum subsp. funduliforme B35]|uniref:Uncharacterized protein n=1 Tax=Fusobacterium necrophorum subsp. funduliforme B35 TaxID=1226633 RepID=A0A0B4E5F6_9FUSO|nr:hypothetical protein C095_08295 [Fusobacterium necrophorum subsp. funduliforme B35]
MRFKKVFGSHFLLVDCIDEEESMKFLRGGL